MKTAKILDMQEHITRQEEKKKQMTRGKMTKILISLLERYKTKRSDIPEDVRKYTMNLLNVLIAVSEEQDKTAVYNARKR